MRAEAGRRGGDGDVPALPRVRGLFEAHLTVADLDRSVAFYRELLGRPPALTLAEGEAAFFWAGPPGTTMLGLWSAGPAPSGGWLHLALAVPLPGVLGAPAALRERGIRPLTFFGAEAAEPSVIAWMPAAAVYFRDPDGHLIEYLAMLDQPARPELGIVTWSRWPSVARPAPAGEVR